MSRHPVRLRLLLPAVAGGLILTACSGGGSTAPSPPETAPRISGLDPVQARAGEEIRILGEGFGTDPSAVDVLFGDEVAGVARAEETTLLVEVPELSPGQVAVRVSVSDRLSNPAVFEVEAPPFILPPLDSFDGRWQRSLLRTAADGACPDPLPEREVVELEIESAELVLGEAAGTVSFDGTWRATGSIVFDDGSSIRVTIEAHVVIDAGRLAIVGDLVREHLSPEGETTCTETYDLRLDPV